MVECGEGCVVNGGRKVSPGGAGFAGSGGKRESVGCFDGGNVPTRPGGKDRTTQQRLKTDK